MMPYLSWSELVRTIEVPLILFGIALCLLLFLFSISSHRLNYHRLISLKSFHSNESGATYSFSFLMILPFIILLMILIFELTFIFLSKLGTVHAAYAAARVASVHLSNNIARNNFSEDENENNDCQQFTHQAALQGMIPFSTSLFPEVTSSKYEEKAEAFWNAWEQYVEGDNSAHTKKLKKRSVRARYLYAAQSTDVSITTSDAVSGSTKDVFPSSQSDFTQTVTVSVSYKAPIRVPFMRVMFNAPKEDGRAYRIVKTSVTMPIEAPKNKSRAYGINMIRAYQ